MLRAKKSETILRVAGVRKGDALRGLDLEIASGEAWVVAAEGDESVATLFRLLLGYELPDAGSVRILDADPTAQANFVLERVGYVPAVCDAPLWMRPKDYLRFVGLHYAEWNEDLADELCESFGVDDERRFGDLDVIDRWRLQLLAALTCQPRLLICDRPCYPVRVEDYDRWMYDGPVATALQDYRDQGGAVIAVLAYPVSVPEWASHLCTMDRGVVQVREAPDVG